MDCPVCMLSFDDTERRPRTMPCGHTLCSPCIKDVTALDSITCPTCRATHAVPRGGQFPVCYAMEDLLRKLKGTEITPVPAATGSGQRRAGGLSRRIRSMLEEQEAKVVAAISTCQKIQSQLHQYQKALADWCQEQKQLEDGLQSVMDKSKAARELMCGEESKVLAKKLEVEEEEDILHAKLKALQGVTTAQEAMPVIDDADLCTDEAEQAAEECQEMFPDVNTINIAKKARVLPKAALEAVQSIQTTLQTVGSPAGAAAAPRPPPDSACSITDRLHAILTPSLASLEVTDLINLSQPVRSLVQASQVFAVQHFHGGRRYGKISRDGGQFYLHVLQEQPLPPGAVTLQVSEVIPPHPPCQVFLDLSWPGSEAQRVIIHLSHDTPHGKQFLLLCTGQQGLSYASSTLLRAFRKGQPGEHVFGGDYEINDGTGGHALLPDLEEYDYPSSGKAGSLWARFTSPYCAAQFGILTMSRDDGVRWNGVFGKVTRGLHVLKKAACHENIKEVTVVDCGIVLFSGVQK